MKKKRVFAAFMLLCMSCLGLCSTEADAATRQTIYNSPYVSFSPDGKAWTTNAGDSDYEWYPLGTEVNTGIASSLRGLQQGEHYYTAPRQGEVPVGRWEVAYRAAHCIHNAYPRDGRFHGVNYGTNKCGGYYYSGWNAYCADCGERIVNYHLYMSREAAESIDYIDLGSPLSEMDYYYLCPHCNNLEQGRFVDYHECKFISWNQYKVEYKPNFTYHGTFMADSFHMYNNATEYNGVTVTPITHLSRNTYNRNGYEFVGWNTAPNGSGRSFADQAEIFNLNDRDWENDRTAAVVTLYAQWRPSRSTLRIDPNGGAYGGHTGITSITQNYGTNCTINDNAVIPPQGALLSFDTQGGRAVASIRSILHFTTWSKQQPFSGRIRQSSYYFIASDGNTDTIRANYEREAVTLPNATHPDGNRLFGGWYTDPSCTVFFGNAGDSVTVTQDITLYAKWSTLHLDSVENWTANGRKGAVDLTWVQNDVTDKIYKVFQSKGRPNGAYDWKQLHEEGVTNGLRVSEAWNFTDGSEQIYVVPYDGVYEFDVRGAQGANYGANTGGLGGQVVCRVYLYAGETVAFCVGGQNGAGADFPGGTASAYGNGGGASYVWTQRLGYIAVAGGGGGATLNNNGLPGGSNEALREDGSGSGASGMAGGGGGLIGGKDGR